VGRKVSLGSVRSRTLLLGECVRTVLEASATIGLERSRREAEDRPGTGPTPGWPADAPRTIGLLTTKPCQGKPDLDVYRPLAYWSLTRRLASWRAVFGGVFADRLVDLGHEGRTIDRRRRFGGWLSLTSWPTGRVARWTPSSGRQSVHIGSPS
jgi:hypothetical protein